MSMCKLNTVKSARKPQGKCSKCGTAIEVGDPYRWWQGRYTRKWVRCMAASCTPAHYERETNPLRSEHMMAEGLVSEAQSITTYTPAEVITPLQSAYDALEGVRDELQSRVDGWQGTNLENSQQYASCEDTIYNLDDWLSTTQGILSELESLEEIDPTLEGDELEDAEAELLEAIEVQQGEIGEVPELDLGA